MRVPGVFKSATEIREVPAGSVIFETGDPGNEMYGVIDGRVEIHMARGAIHTLGAEQTFGEMAIVDSSPRSATARAITDTRLAVIDRKTFLFLVHETPMFALQVMGNMAERLRSAD